MKFYNWIKRRKNTVISVLIWLLIWQGLAYFIQSNIFFVGPWQTLHMLFLLLKDPKGALWTAMMQSFWRIFCGFFLSIIFAAVLASLAYRSRVAASFFQPLLYTVKSVPIASFIILALLWTGSRYLSGLMAFLIGLPILYTALLTGLRETDPKLLEMADCFRIRGFHRICRIYFPAVQAQFLAAVSTAYGMGWKAGIAAELIGVPEGSVGEQLYYAKLYLETDQVLAWTVAIVLFSFMTEWVLLKVMRGFMNYFSKCQNGRCTHVLRTWHRRRCTHVLRTWHRSGRCTHVLRTWHRGR